MVSIRFPSYNSVSFSAPAVAALRSHSLAGIQDGMIAFVGGQTALDDGNGGVFAWSADSVAADDGLDTVAPQGVSTGRWLRVISNSVAAPFIQSATGAVARSQAAKFGDTISVKDFGAVPGSSNSTAAIQVALNYAATIAPATVIANHGQYTCDEVSVPSDVEFRCNLKLRTAATVGNEKNAVRVNPRSRVIGRIEGSNTTASEVVERGIYPAANGCHDVYLDVEVLKTTVGVAALYSDLSDPPRRWSGTIRCTDIAGYMGGSNGYGLNGTLCDSTLRLFTTNVPRHGLYLSASASNNHITVHDTGGRYTPIDIAAFDTQAGCHNNVIKAFVRDHKANYPGLNHYAGFISGKCSRNTVEIHVSDCAPLNAAFYMQANSAAAAPKDNQVTVYFDGQIKGTAVAEINSTSGTRIKVYGSGSGTDASFRGVVYVGRNDAITPTSPRAVAVEIDALDFASSGNIAHGVIAVIDYALVDLGRGVIKATGVTGTIVNFSTFGAYVRGWIYETSFTGTSASIGSGSAGDIVITFDNALPQRKYITYSVIFPAANGLTLPDHAIVSTGDTNMTVTVKNNTASSATATIVGRAWGF